MGYLRDRGFTVLQFQGVMDVQGNRSDMTRAVQFLCSPASEESRGRRGKP